MLVKAALHQPPPDFTEPDIYDYGVESILVVDRDILVDVFVKNGFHAQQHVLVISINRYPAYLLAEARKALDANPRLTSGKNTRMSSNLHGQLPRDAVRNMKRYLSGQKIFFHGCAG